VKVLGGEQFLQGKGTGSLPTGAAVLSDISALSFAYKYEFKKRKQNKGMCLTNDVLLKIYLRYNSEEEYDYFIMICKDGYYFQSKNYNQNRLKLFFHIVI
jgi:hypothetical protein